MKIYTDAITLQSQKPRQVFNITTQVKAAMEKSGLRDGIILVSSLHPNSAVIVNDDEPGLLQDLDKWLAEIAPARDDYAHQAASKATPRFISKACCSVIRSSFHSPKRASILVRANLCNSSSLMDCAPGASS